MIWSVAILAATNSEPKVGVSTVAAFWYANGKELHLQSVSMP